MSPKDKTNKTEAFQKKMEETAEALTTLLNNNASVQQFLEGFDALKMKSWNQPNIDHKVQLDDLVGKWLIPDLEKIKRLSLENKRLFEQVEVKNEGLEQLEQTNQQNPGIDPKTLKAFLTRTGDKSQLPAKKEAVKGKQEQRNKKIAESKNNKSKGLGPGRG